MPTPFVLQVTLSCSLTEGARFLYVPFCSHAGSAIPYPRSIQVLFFINLIDVWILDLICIANGWIEDG
jgi:hypothetical protein